MKVLTKGLDVHALFWVWASVILTPAMAMAGGLGFQVAGGLMGLSAIFVWAADRSAADYLKSAWPIALLAFVFWAWISMLWSPYGGAFFGGNASVLFIVVILLLFLPTMFLRISGRARKFLTWAVMAAGVAGVLLLLFDSAGGFALSLWGDPARPGEDMARRLGDAEMNLGRGQISYAQFIWPVAALMCVTLKRGWILAALCMAGLALSAWFNDLTIVPITLLLAGVVAVSAWRKPRSALIAAFVLAGVSILFAPLIGMAARDIDPALMREFPLSWEHRLRMWSYSWELIQQAPLFGHGFDSARTFNELTFRAPDGRDIPVLSLHTHNIGLQIWLETGLLGAMLFAGFLAALARQTLKTCVNSAQGFAAAGLIVSTTIVGMTTVGVWQHWWWALIVFAAGLVILVARDPQLIANPTKK